MSKASTPQAVMGPYLTQLPSEILHHVLTYVNPKDLGVLPQVCRYLHGYLKDNGALFRTVYYDLLDKPVAREIDWTREIRDLVKLEAICNGQEISKAELPFVCATVTRLLGNASRDEDAERQIRSMTYAKSRNVDVLTRLFSHERVQDAFLARSLLFERARGEANSFQEPPKEEHQQSAKLHCLYGVPMLKFGRTRSSRMYPFACSKVYDLRQYTDETHWGPFMQDGSDRVDWEKVEAILLVLGNNIKDRRLDRFPIFSNFWSVPFAGTWPNSYLRWPPHGEEEAKEEESACEKDTSEIEEARRSKQLQLEDPYDVSGTWLRVVCFLDYNDFYNYNFPAADELPENVPRPALSTGEATRVILLKVHVTKIEYPEGQSRETGAWPVVHFKGFSRSLDASWDENANSDIRGMVRTTAEGEIRWTTFSIFGGTERWRSESVQVGGPKSAKVIVGNWFEKDYDPQGPCGPTAFWKISDHEPESEDLQVLRDDFLRIVDGNEDDLHDHIHDHVHEYDHDHFDDEDDFSEELIYADGAGPIPTNYDDDDEEDDEDGEGETPLESL